MEHDPRLIQLEWTGDRELTIRHPEAGNDTPVFRCDSPWQDVRIRCETYTPDENQLEISASSGTAEFLDVVGQSQSPVPAANAGAAICGIWRSGMGLPAKRRRHGIANQRTHSRERDTRALSVAMPVSAYIWR